MLRGLVWIAGILVLSLLMGGGLWVWMTRASDDQGPQFQTVSVDPQLLRFAGGRAVIQARVSDTNGVDRVGGLVMHGGQQRQLPTQDTSVDSREFTYIAEFLAPPNIRNDGVAQDYLVRLVAVDTSGQETTREVSFQVAAPAVPPLPPLTNFSP